jgi:FKBP-type peptidyl-prolyl cis-trans isomerase FkpA
MALHDPRLAASVRMTPFTLVCARPSACPNLPRMKRRWMWLVFGVAATSAACSKRVAEPTASAFKPAEAAPVDPGPAKLQIFDDVVGKGPEARPGDTVRVHYTGTLMNGITFDSSRERGTPFDFKLGGGSVIKGWDDGVIGMKVGGKRRLVIPQDLGYGENGSPPKIPEKAGLKFDIELLEVNPADAAVSSAPPADPDMPPFDPDQEFDPNEPPP